LLNCIPIAYIRCDNADFVGTQNFLTVDEPTDDGTGVARVDHFVHNFGALAGPHIAQPFQKVGRFATGQNFQRGLGRSLEAGMDFTFINPNSYY
jgi:hypothetical protein